MSRYSQTWMGRAQSQAGTAAHFFRNMLPPGKLRQRVDNLATRRSPVDTWLQAHEVFGYQLAHRLSGTSGSPGGQEAKFVAILDGIEANWRHESPVGLSCLLDTRVYMVNQLLRDADAASMAHSLELRVPLVDLEVMGFSRSCDDRFKLSASGGKTGQYQSSGAKKVLIHALRDVLPADVAQRRKRGFELPFNNWLGGALADLVEDTCGRDSLRRRGLVNPDLVQDLRTAAAAGNQSLYPKVWSLLIFELWCRAVLDSPSKGLSRNPLTASVQL
jgi:asparagine synthetase B (glutamine-hydrolysing)